MRQTKTITASGSATPKSPSPAQHPLPEGMESGLLRRHPHLALPLCLFSSFQDLSPTHGPLYDCSVSGFLKKFLRPCVVGFSGTGQHCQESEKGKASAWFKHRGWKMMAQVPSKLVPDPSVHPFGPQFTGGMPLCCAQGLQGP